jgi:cobalamin biosynthesis Mg chelatase CobN
MVVSGDPFGSRILALLLIDSGYRAEFLAIWSLNEPGALEDVQLLVLTPTWALLSTEEHDALLSSLREMTRDRGLIVMELISLSEERRTEQEEEAQELPSYKVLWPCGIDELEERIEAALRTATR